MYLIEDYVHNFYRCVVQAIDGAALLALLLVFVALLPVMCSAFASFVSSHLRTSFQCAIKFAHFSLCTFGLLPHVPRFNHSYSLSRHFLDSSLFLIAIAAYFRMQAMVLPINLIESFLC